MTNPVKTKTLTLDNQLELLAQEHNISLTQLKTVYFRGVEEYVNSDITYGSAVMYGLARVQRFISERGAHIDTDLVADNQPLSVIDTAVELSDENAALFLDVIYTPGTSIADLFYPGVVHSIEISEQSLRVEGSIHEMAWFYELDMVSGKHQLSVQ